MNLKENMCDLAISLCGRLYFDKKNGGWGGGGGICSLCLKRFAVLKTRLEVYAAAHSVNKKCAKCQHFISIIFPDIIGKPQKTFKDC